MSEPTKSNKTDRPPTPQLEVPPENRPSHLTSLIQLYTGLVLKMQTQCSRLECIREIANALPICYFDTSLEELNEISAQLEEIHKAFAKEHSYIEATCPNSSALIQHRYFSEDIHGMEARNYMAVRLNIAKLKHSIVEELKLKEIWLTHKLKQTDSKCSLM